MLTIRLKLRSLAASASTSVPMAHHFANAPDGSNSCAGLNRNQRCVPSLWRKPTVLWCDPPFAGTERQPASRPATSSGCTAACQPVPRASSALRPVNSHQRRLTKSTTPVGSTVHTKPGNASTMSLSSPCNRNLSWHWLHNHTTILQKQVASAVAGPQKRSGLQVVHFEKR